MINRKELLKRIGDLESSIYRQAGDGAEPAQPLLFGLVTDSLGSGNYAVDLLAANGETSGSLAFVPSVPKNESIANGTVVWLRLVRPGLYYIIQAGASNGSSAGVLQGYVSFFAAS